MGPVPAPRLSAVRLPPGPSPPRALASIRRRHTVGFLSAPALRRVGAAPASAVPQPQATVGGRAAGPEGAVAEHPG